MIIKWRKRTQSKINKVKTQQKPKNSNKDNDNIGMEDKVQAYSNTVTINYININTNTNKNEECDEYEHTVLNSNETREIKEATQSQGDNKDVDDEDKEAVMTNEVTSQIYD